MTVPEKDRIEVDIQEYLDNHLGTEKDKKDTYFAEFMTRKHYKAKNIFLRNARVRKVMIGYNASEETKAKILKIAGGLGVECEQMTEDMMKSDDNY